MLYRCLSLKELLEEEEGAGEVPGIVSEAIPFLLLLQEVRLMINTMPATMQTITENRILYAGTLSEFSDDLMSV